MKSIQALLFVPAWVTSFSLAISAPIYKVGDVVTNFSLVNRATGQPLQLTDLHGKIILLDWFAWWCPYCQAAAPQLLTGVDQWYDTRNGNPAGIPILHVGVNLQPGQEPQTQNFVNRAQFPLVLQDFNRAVANRFATDGQPIFAIINGVTNSPNHKPWELLYSQPGYGQTTFPVNKFRAAIDDVKAAPIAPPAPPVLSGLTIDSDGSVRFHLNGAVGRSYRVESSANLKTWTEVQTITSATASDLVRLAGGTSASSLFFRAVAL